MFWVLKWTKYVLVEKWLFFIFYNYAILAGDLSVPSILPMCIGEKFPKSSTLEIQHAFNIWIISEFEIIPTWLSINLLI